MDDEIDEDDVSDVSNEVDDDDEDDDEVEVKSKSKNRNVNDRKNETPKKKTKDQIRIENLIETKEMLLSDKNNLTVEKDKLTEEKDKLTARNQKLTQDLEKLQKNFEKIKNKHAKLKMKKDILKVKLDQYNNDPLAPMNDLDAASIDLESVKNSMRSYQSMTKDTLEFLSGPFWDRTDSVSGSAESMDPPSVIRTQVRRNEKSKSLQKE